MEDPTATYVPHNPMAGLTAVGNRKDMGLFPGWTLLRYSKRKTKIMRTESSYKKSFNKKIN